MTSADPCPVFFLSDSTGITAETLGNTMLSQFPTNNFDRTTVPFLTTVEQAEAVVKAIDGLAARGLTPIVFSTAVSSDIRSTLARCKGTLVDLFGTYIGQLEEALATRASGDPGRAHGLGNAARYQSRMNAVEYAMEHDDGQSLRALEKTQVILGGPVSLRQDTHHNVSGVAARYRRRELPPRSVQHSNQTAAALQAA